MNSAPARRKQLRLFRLAALALALAMLSGCKGAKHDPAPRGKYVRVLKGAAAEAAVKYKESAQRNGAKPDSQELQNETVAWFAARLEKVRALEGDLRVSPGLAPGQARELQSLRLSVENLIITLKEAYRLKVTQDPTLADAQLSIARDYLKSIGEASDVTEEKREEKRAMRAKKTRGRPNVLFIMIDTLRADHLGAYGYSRDTTPALDRLASEGALFENAVAQAPYTSASVASLLTGLYPSRHRLLTFYKWEGEKSLVAEFARAGYRTAAFSANQIVSPQNGFGAGFGDFKVLGWTTADALNNEVRRWLLDYSGEAPFFIYVHYMDPHDSYNAPGEFNTMYAPGYRREVNAMWFTHTLENKITFDFDIDAAGCMTADDAMRLLREQTGYPVDRRVIENMIAMYDGEIRFTDEQVKNLLETFRRRGLLDDTIVVATSDHGEAFLEHGHVRHSRTLYDELLRVPLIFWDGGKRFRPSRVKRQAELSGALPAVMRAAGLKVPAGLDFAPLRVDKAQHGGRAALSVTWQGFSYARKEDIPKFAARTEREKLIFTPSVPMYEYYDLTTDPAEQRNLAREEGTVVPEKLKKKLLAFYREFGWMRRKGGKDIDPQLRKDLKSLGYIK